MMPAVAINTVPRMTTTSPCPRDRYAIVVAQPSAASTKNCQGWRPRSDVASGFSRTSLVEIPEFIVDALVDFSVNGRSALRRVFGTPRPAHRREPDHD